MVLAFFDQKGAAGLESPQRGNNFGLPRQRARSEAGKAREG